MRKYLVAVGAAAVAGLALAGFTSEASASSCCGGGTMKPTYMYKTVQKVVNRTVYRNVSKVRYVTRVKPIVHVLRVQPVVRVHQVTRVHVRTVAVVRPVHVYRTQMLPAKVYRTSSVQTSYDCNCR